MIVTLCGSARFEDHFKTWNEALTMAGHTVFTLTRYPSEKGGKLWYTDAQKAALDEAHKRKINASEAVLVLNVFGYMGPSTLSEVAHAQARGKELYALESWGKGNGIGGSHYDHVQAACKRMIPEGYAGSPISTTGREGFRYAYDLLDDVVTHERSYDLVRMVQACDERLKNAPGVRACDPTQAERSQYAGVLRHLIECLRSTGRFTDEEGDTTNQLEDLLVILEARTAGVRVPDTNQGD